MSHFTKIKYSDYSNYSGISSSIRFKGISTVKIPIPSPKGKAVNLILINIKYCPAIGPFNLISMSQLFWHKKGKPTLIEHSISWYINNILVNTNTKHSL
jgi:hypothetical protein